MSFGSAEGHDLSEFVPKSNGEITDDPFRLWWWNNDSTKGDIGNNYAIWNSFYYVGDNEYPIREGDEELVEEGYVWLDGDDPSTFVWTDDKSADFPIRYVGVKFAQGSGFFAKPTCKNPSLDIAGQVLQPVENVAYVPLKFDADKTMLSNPFPVAVNLADLVPCEADGEKITDDPFRMWWWNNDSSKGDIGNNYAIWNSFYYVGDN